MRSTSVAVLALLLIIMLTFTSCITVGDGSLDENNNNTVSVGIVHADGYSVKEGIQTVASGSSVTFTVIAQQGYTIVDFSHSDYEALGNGVYRFNNILYPVMIEVYYAPTATVSPEVTQPTTTQPTTTQPTTTEPTTTQPELVTTPDVPSVNPNTTQGDPLPNINLDINNILNDPSYINSIVYCFNSGSYAGSEGVSMMFVTPDTTHHKRINTANSQGKLTRDGYTLVGWNTKKDGSGEHISLGSRCTLNTKGATVLYASWQKWSDAENFTYTKSGKEAHITSYSADETVIAIPAYIDGLKVTKVKSGAFKDKSCQKVILPDTVLTVESKAFNNCDLTTLHFYDTVVTVDDSAFYKCSNFSTIYINQYLKPIYIKANSKADAYDILILNKDKNIVAFLAGSSMNYGLDAYRATESLSQVGYEAVNLGFMAFRNTICQVQIITALINENDVLLHAPEPSSSWQTFRNNSMQASLWPMYDNNLDLFSYADIRLLSDTFSSLCGHFKNKRNSTKNYTYDDYCQNMDDRGYITTNRPVSHKADWRPTGGGTRSMNADQINDTSISNMKKLYGAVEAKGAKVYLSYCPFNKNCFSDASKDPAVRQGYVDQFKKAGYPILGAPDDFFYDGSYFHDTEYHLVTKGAQEHTDKMVELIKAQLKKDNLA